MKDWNANSHRIKYDFYADVVTPTWYLLFLLPQELFVVCSLVLATPGTICSVLYIYYYTLFIRKTLTWNLNINILILILPSNGTKQWNRKKMNSGPTQATKYESRWPVFAKSFFTEVWVRRKCSPKLNDEIHHKIHLRWEAATGGFL